MPGLRTYESDSEGEQTSMPLLRSSGQKRIDGKNKPKKLLAITDGRGVDDNDDSVPELRTDSSGESDEDFSVSENDSEEIYHDDESEYDSEEEERYRTMLRDAMDTAMAIPEFFDPRLTVPDFDALAERKGNPFLKLLGSLRGEMTVPYVLELHKLIYPQGVCFPPTRGSARPHVLSRERVSLVRRGRVPKLPPLLRRVQRFLMFLAVKSPPHSPHQAKNAHVVGIKP